MLLPDEGSTHPNTLAGPCKIDRRPAWNRQKRPEPTQKRQSAAIDLAHKVEVMLVIGDQQSANTKRLTELCTKAGTKTYQIQTLSEFDPNWIKGKQKIGITAGASTPEWIISEVISFLNENS